MITRLEVGDIKNDPLYIQLNITGKKGNGDEAEDKIRRFLLLS